jgi:hypothetical protein
VNTDKASPHLTAKIVSSAMSGTIDSGRINCPISSPQSIGHSANSDSHQRPKRFALRLSRYGNPYAMTT